MKTNSLSQRQPLELYFALEPLWLRPLSFISRLFHGPAPVNARRLLIAMMAKLADADGIRQPQETELLDNCLTLWFGENQDSKIKAFRMLREIRKSPTSFESYAREFAKAFSWSLSMRANAFDALCRIAFSDGNLEYTEDEMLLKAARIFSLPDSEVRRLRQQYASYQSERQGNRGQGSSERAGSQKQERSESVPNFQNSFHWSQTLGCSPGSSASEVKQAYRKLVMLYHPDRLKSHGLPPEQLQTATERFLKIQSAYEEALRQLKH